MEQITFLIKSVLEQNAVPLPLAPRYLAKILQHILVRLQS